MFTEIVLVILICLYKVIEFYQKTAKTKKSHLRIGRRKASLIQQHKSLILISEEAHLNSHLTST